MYTIWKLRCEWRISKNSDPEKTFTDREVIQRIRVAITQRMKLDCLVTDGERFEKKAHKPRLVKSTWSNLIPDDVFPLRLWKKLTVVLVGIR